MYIVASRTGPLTASELSRATAVHRVHGYRFLKDLVERGLLRPVGTRPMRFAALPVEELVDRWIGDASRRLDGLRRDRDQILHEWKVSGEGIEDTTGRQFTVIEEIDSINRFVERRWGAARRSIDVTARASSLPHILDGGLGPSLRAAAKRGVKIRMVTEVNASNLAEAKIISSSVEMRHSPRHVSQPDDRRGRFGGRPLHHRRGGSRLLRRGAGDALDLRAPVPRASPGSTTDVCGAAPSRSTNGSPRSRAPPGPSSQWSGGAPRNRSDASRR